MAQVGRLAGALLAESQGRYFLVGNTKEPCDWHAVGIRAPEVIDAVARPYIELTLERPVVLSEPRLIFEIEGEALVQMLAERMLIRRNGSVSERLWRLVSGTRDEDPDAEAGAALAPASGPALGPDPVQSPARTSMQELPRGANDGPDTGGSAQPRGTATEQSGALEIQVRWLSEMPGHVWDIVRDSVLRCL